MRSIEKGSITLLEPVGDLTPALSHDLRAMVRKVARPGRHVEVSLRKISHVSWSGVCALASAIAEDGLTQLRFRSVLPRVRSLMHEAGVGPQHIID